MEREIKPYVLKRSEEEAHPAKLSLDYAAALNPQQLAAVTAGDGPSLVIAGAGSGKTRALVYRVAYLIDKGVDPAAILLLTFTRKSAQEMLQRAGVLIGARSERVQGGTFHSVANLLLRRYGRPIGLEPGFTILDRSDAEDLINLLRAQMGMNEKDKRFPRKATIAEIFSKCENTLQGSTTWCCRSLRISRNIWTRLPSSKSLRGCQAATAVDGLRRSSGQAACTLERA